MEKMRELLYEGKSKVIYAGDCADTCVMCCKDTATALNGAHRADFEGKGHLNSAISNLIYAYLEENGIKTHLLEVLDERSVLVRRAEIIMVEVIVRNAAAGSFSQKYGVDEGTALMNTVVEFCLKSDELSDPMINISQITALSIASRDELEEMIRQAVLINDLLCELFSRAGIRLIDFKLEFGRVDGGIVLCDEISPDSCRLWDVQTDEKLDKDRFRRGLGNLLDGYEEVLRRLRDVRQI